MRLYTAGVDFTAPTDAAPLPNYLVQYSQTLKEQYSRLSVLPDSEWPPSVGDQFINLALINEDIQCATGESVQEMQRDYVCGKLDKIVSYKKKISKEDIFQPVYNKRTKEQIPLCVLLDGAPGAGKTTLCRELCQEWADGVLLQNYKLVVLVHLRERNNKQAQSIEDFFFHDFSISRSEIAKHINRENVLFIFDGFDELSYKDRTQHSVFLDIIAGRVLHKCSVVVTSRPHASETLQRSKSINRHVQVLGFTEEQISECIKRTVKDESKAEELCTQLKDRLDITSLCSIPLNCAIMLYVYQQENFRLPNTVTGLFDIFTVNALTRHAKRMGITRKLRTLNDLPSPLDKQFIVLCKMAYEGLRANKLIFSEKDLEMAFGVTDTELHTQFLDLLTSNTSYTSRGEQKTYHFLHLTIQEFLAAKWLEGMCKTAPGRVVELFKTIYKHDHLRLTLLFVAGLTRLEFSDPMDVLNYAKPHQSLLDRKSQQQVVLFYLNAIFEARNDQITQLYAHGRQDISITPEYMTDFDYFVVAYFLSHSKSTTWKSVQISRFYAKSPVEITEKQLILFCKGFSDCKKSEVKIENLFLDCRGMENLLVLSHLEHICSFQNVIIEATESCFDSTQQTSALRVRNISDFRVRKRDQRSKIDKHFEALSYNNNLRSFTCEVEANVRHSVYEMISKNKCLTSLTLGLVHHVSEELLEDISQGLVQNTTLQTLTVDVSADVKPDIIQWRQTSMGGIMRHFNKQLHLEQLVINFFPSAPDFSTRGTSFKTEAKTIADALANTGSLKQLKLEGIYFTRPELNELGNGLQKNKTLQKLQTAYYNHEFKTTCKAIDHASFVRNTESGEMVLEQLLSEMPEMETKLSTKPTQASVSRPPTACSRIGKCGGCEKGEREVWDCSHCKTISYCSPECQRNDWPRHQPDCVARKCGGCAKSESQERKLKNCTGCMKVAYCSRECQRNDWPEHKRECKRP